MCRGRNSGPPARSGSAYGEAGQVQVRVNAGSRGPTELRLFFLCLPTRLRWYGPRPDRRRLQSTNFWFGSVPIGMVALKSMVPNHSSFCPDIFEPVFAANIAEQDPRADAEGGWTELAESELQKGATDDAAGINIEIIESGLRDAAAENQTLYRPALRTRQEDQRVRPPACRRAGPGPQTIGGFRAHR